ncbi:MAG: M23 family metallopeptidase [Clostridiales bacterium]|jgi:murein DD-endopeptidase MepM/ murein hydrolase activator NlpD|nr:M23 family metallopeptidase [Clostridiales bacterium]
MANSNFSERVKGFFKKNYYYVIIAVCIAAIGTVITTAALKSGKNPVTPPIDEPDKPSTVIPEDSGKETDTAPVYFLMPLEGATGTGLVYDENELQYSATLNQWSAHYGVDYLAPEGTDVFAAYDGVVESVVTNEMWGTKIVILHDGGIRSVYACLGANVGVLERQKVAKGQKIGVVSNTGYLEASQGSHLHFELTADDKNINPVSYFEENK